MGLSYTGVTGVHTLTPVPYVGLLHTGVTGVHTLFRVINYLFLSTQLADCMEFTNILCQKFFCSSASTDVPLECFRIVNVFIISLMLMWYRYNKE